MPNKPRYLIVTADERTWKFDRPVIFLGEWCRLYNRRHVWQDMDAIVGDHWCPAGSAVGVVDEDKGAEILGASEPPGAEVGEEPTPTVQLSR